MPVGERVEAAGVFVLVEGAFRVPVDNSVVGGATFSRQAQLFRGTAFAGLSFVSKMLGGELRS